MGIIPLFIFVLIMTILAFWVRGVFWKPGASTPQVKVFGFYSHLLTRIKYRRYINTEFQLATWEKVQKQFPGAAEWTAIIVWALWLGRHYLTMNSMEWLFGDWGLNVQSYFAWGLVQKCGACVFWNGYFNGGAPLFTDLLAAMAHPFVVLLVVLAGAVNGSKLIGVSGLVLAGLAQWYWGKVLRLGPIPRLWGAAMAVVGGYLIGRLESGLVEMVFSTASFSLAIAAAVHLAQSGKRRVAVALGIFTGLAFLSGQGYLQVGFILGVCPALVILLIDKQFKFRPVWREFAFAAILAVLISAVLWVPVLHDFGKISKPTTDTGFVETQSIEYQPLNLVIRDLEYYENSYLGKLPWPNQTANFIGWIPILFVLLSLRLIPRSKIQLMLFFWAAIIMVYAVSSAVIIKWLIQLAPAIFEPLLTKVRFPSMISGLAIPLILALASWGLDLLLRLKWPKLTLSLPTGVTFHLNLAWLVVLLLGASVKISYDFVKPWLEIMPIPTDAMYYSIISQIKPKTVQWVQPPDGDWGFMIAALDNDIKLTNVYHLWSLTDRIPPQPYLTATREAMDPSADPNYKGSVEYLSQFEYPDNYYAYVDIKGRKIPCQASAQGGNIDIDCQTDAPGQLVVAENSWSGWSVKQDNIRVALDSSPWLATKAPAGAHHYAFRYRPWDVFLGIILSMSGVGLAVWLWIQKPKKQKRKAKDPIHPLPHQTL